MPDPFPSSSTLLPGPSFSPPLLAPLDALHPTHYSRRLLLFRLPPTATHASQLATLRAGLEALLRRCPLLAGRVVPDSSPDSTSAKKGPTRRSISPGPGLELVTVDQRATLPSFADLEAANFPPSSLPYHLLIPVPQDLDLGETGEYAVCKVQMSAIEGGTVLGWAMSHTLADGVGTDKLLIALGRAMNGDVEETVLGMDRSVLATMKSERRFEISEHPSYAPTPAPVSYNSASTHNSTASSTSISSSPSLPHPFHPTTPQQPLLFSFSPSALAAFKADATPPGSRISTHDALVALIWRSTMLMRTRRASSSPSSTSSSSSSSTSEPHDDPTTTVFFPTSARKYLLTLPDPYVGNSVYQARASLPLSSLLAPHPHGLRSAASAIRASLARVTPELVESYFAELVENGWVEWGFMSHADPAGQGGGLEGLAVAMGTDWGAKEGGVYGAGEWGEMWGEVVRQRYAGEQGGGGLVLPLRRDGTAEVVIGCQEGEEELLEGKEAFGRYLSTQQREKY